MDKTMQVQAQIRHNAEGISAALSDMSKWEKQIKTKDKKLMEQAKTGVRAPVRSGAGTVAVKSAPTSVSAAKKDEPTPFSIGNIASAQQSAKPIVAKALGVHVDVDPEEAERERGNLDFKNGNFTAAVKAYTKCLGMKSKNYVAFSNRAMAYLKLKEYSRAVVDCNAALQIEQNHVKSLLRRASAYNSLGKHRAALVDLNRALELEPTSKQARTELQVTKELLRNAVNRAPLINVPINFGLSTEDKLEVMQGPDPSPPSWTPSAAPATVAEIAVEASKSAEIESSKTAGVSAGTLASSGETASASLAQYYHSNNPVRVPSSSSSSSSSTCTTTAASAAAGGSSSDGAQTHRIPISVDDDEDDEEDEVEIKINSSSSSGTVQESSVPDRYIDKYAIAAASAEAEVKTESSAKPTTKDAAVTPTKEATKKTKKATSSSADSGSKTKGSNKSKSSSSSSGKYTSYDLMRELTNSRMNLKKLAVIFGGLKASQVSSILQGLMEADLLFLLLKAVYVYFSGNGSEEFPFQPEEIVRYYEAVSGSSSFGLMYSLLPAEERKTVENYLEELRGKVCGEMEEEVQRVRSVYCRG